MDILFSILKFKDLDLMFDHLKEIEEVMRKSKNFSLTHTIYLEENWYILETKTTATCVN